MDLEKARREIRQQMLDAKQRDLIVAEEELAIAATDAEKEQWQIRVDEATEKVAALEAKISE